jgi:ArsR family transcriptional regulator, arsenate/arsenite/antimonite-responsive transcriptional repressor
LNDRADGSGRSTAMGELSRDRGSERLARLRALADPVRLALVDELTRDDACACELRERLDLSAPLLSHHLKVLREAGLVRTRRAGRRLEVELDETALAALAESLGRRAA